MGIKDNRLFVLKKNIFYIAVGLFFVVALTTGFALAHDDGDGHDEEPALSVLEIRDQNIRVAVAAAGFLAFLTFMAIWWKDSSEDAKKGIFILMIVIVVLPTIYFVVSTLRVNFASPYGGPVHWHADFKIFACGTELDPPVPERFSNKTGTPVLHEHEDRRLHVEGVVVEDWEASLANFFAVQGGELVGGRFKVPTGMNSFVEYSDGDTCSNGQRGEWNVFLYETGGTDTAYQRKLSIDEYPGYLLSPYQTVPPGDCIIFEFGPEKDSTTEICDFYQIALNKGELKLAE